MVARRKAGLYPLRYGIIVVTSLIGVFISIGLFIAIGNWQAHLEEVRFSSLARDHLQIINSGLKDATDLLYSMRAHFESLDHGVSRTEYQAFSHSLRERVVGLRDTGWAPRVTAAARDDFEQAIRATGFPDFQILERNAEGKLVPAGKRDEYFPILYSDPDELNRSIMGFDLTSEAMRSRVVARARQTDRPAATPPIKLMNMQRPNGGIMSFIPVIGLAKGETAGVVLGAFETSTMIENILATKLNLVGLDMYVFDPVAAPLNRLIYWHSASGKPPPAEASLLGQRHWQGTLELIDQHWGAILVPTAAFDAGVSDATGLVVLAGGLTMTGSIVAYLLISLRRTQQLEKLTASLRETTEELQRNGAKLDHLARHDALTNLQNRLAFREEASAALRRAHRGQDLAVLYLDLDRFKAVNDTLGHPVGDQLLCLVADRLRDTARETDCITRLGGDEFAIAQSGAEQPRAAETLARRVIEKVSLPYDIDGQRVVIGVSVGITLAGRDDFNVDQLLRRADMALYAAKHDGRGTSRFFEPVMEHNAQLRRGLEMDLRLALEQGDLEIYYQPQVLLNSGQVTGLEALLRWHHPERGLVMPGDFIRCAEDTGLIVPIGTWVLHTALGQAAQWPEGVRVAVNLSPYQLAREDMLQTVEAALAASGQPGTRLELEITENALLEHPATGMEKLKHLRALGIRITLDDFGTGYASLSHLRSFLFDSLKIDQSFVADMTESPEGAAIIRTIIQLAANLNIATTAEGVETAKQFDQLAASGCHEGQGFFFSPACPASEVPRLLADWPRIKQRFARQPAHGALRVQSPEPLRPQP
jgi:diguanylate cyclase (GGDEF)-like protein